MTELPQHGDECLPLMAFLETQSQWTLEIRRGSESEEWNAAGADAQATLEEQEDR
jgi:hypothetical protein